MDASSFQLEKNLPLNCNLQIVKYFVDPKTSQKINFVYPNNVASMELMKTFFDTENLPSEFGGKATLKYDHEEFSKLMDQEDVKTAIYWGLDHKTSNNGNDCSEAGVAPEPLSLALPVSWPECRVNFFSFYCQGIKSCCFQFLINWLSMIVSKISNNLT